MWELLLWGVKKRCRLNFLFFRCVWRGPVEKLSQSLPRICPPHHFFAEGVEEVVSGALYNADVEGGTADGKAGVFVASLASSVDGDEEVVATAAHFEGDFPIVAHDNGAHVEAIRGMR